VDCWRPVIPSELEDAVTATAEIQALKEAHRKTWASGDYPRVAERVTEMNAADDGRFRAPSEYLVTLAGKLS
jgi:hypothetical protein